MKSNSFLFNLLLPCKLRKLYRLRVSHSIRFERFTNMIVYYDYYIPSTLLDFLHKHFRVVSVRFYASDMVYIYVNGIRIFGL